MDNSNITDLFDNSHARAVTTEVVAEPPLRYRTNYLSFAAYLRTMDIPFVKIEAEALTGTDEAGKQRTTKYVYFDVPRTINTGELERRFRNRQLLVEPVRFAEEYYALKQKIRDV